jgi:hypothetical protein
VYYFLVRARAVSFLSPPSHIHSIPPSRKVDHSQKSVLLLFPFILELTLTVSQISAKHAKSAWKKERTSWRVVIQLNLLRSIIRILDALRAEMDGERPDTSSTLGGGGDDHSDDHHHKSSIVFSDKHQLLILRLAPLRKVDLDLKRLLGAGSEEVRPSSGFTHPALFDMDPPTTSKRASGSHRTWRRTDEFHIRSLMDTFARTGEHSKDAQQSTQPNPGSTAIDPTTEVIARCKDDMKTLWEDSTVRSVLSRRKIRLEDSAGLFVAISIFSLFRFPHHSPVSLTI